MARPKANKDKAPVVPQPVAPAAAPVAPRQVVEVENFIRVRDSTISRLKTVQQLFKTCTDDFFRQTNLLLGLPAPLEEVGFNEPMVALQGALDNIGSLNVIPQPMMIAPPQEEQKKERKKRTHDPNAPKRPLTPYFLYMQTARPIIANDLGDQAPKGAVQEEGQRRWATMNPAEKQGWNNAYQYNLRLYHARVHSYKAGNPQAKDMSDADALQYAEAHGIPMPSNDDAGANDQAAIAEQLGGNTADAVGEVDDAPPSKAKKSGGGRKRKTGDADDLSGVPVTPASPAQKRRRSTKAAEAQEEPKKSGRKKAQKS